MKASEIKTLVFILSIAAGVSGITWLAIWGNNQDILIRKRKELKERQSWEKDSTRIVNHVLDSIKISNLEHEVEVLKHK